MREILYIEVPTPNTNQVRDWLQQIFEPKGGLKHATPDGIRVGVAFEQSVPGNLAAGKTGSTAASAGSSPPELSIFVWSLQRTTYLKIFRWADQAFPNEGRIIEHLVAEVRRAFPLHYPEPPRIDLSQQSIFAALEPYYPKTVHYFRKMPQGDYDLTRVYWWEQRWREGVRAPQQPKQVIASVEQSQSAQAEVETVSYDVIYVGGALGVIHAAVMARLGYRVLLLERLPFGRMNREWNISRAEFQSLIELGLFTPDEFESLISREYCDGFHKFFDANNPQQAKAPILHTPTVLNVALNAEKLLRLCGEKLTAAGGDIWDETEFIKADVSPNEVTVYANYLPTQTAKLAEGRLLVDAMGTASPIAWQINGGNAFDSVCPTVGAVIEGGFEAGVWDSQYGDVLNSHGDISRGRQLIWELFPGSGDELTFYLFHYHQICAENPGSLLEMYEDFFSILPEYRRCDPEQLNWKKPTFGYIPGHFSVQGGDRHIAFDRLISIGDAASLQSPLIFTGFGSLVRNLSRLTHLLDTALRHDLLRAHYLEKIRAFQSNVAVTWLFSKGMMVPTGTFASPERINSMLNTFFGILGRESPEAADRFIKDRAGWLLFNRMAIKAALYNPVLLVWIWELAGPTDLIRWLGSYANFTFNAFVSSVFRWVPRLAQAVQPWLEPRFPALWFWLLAQSYALTYGMGQTSTPFKPPSRHSANRSAVVQLSPMVTNSNASERSDT